MYSKTDQAARFAGMSWPNLDTDMTAFYADYEAMQDEIDGHTVQKLKRVPIAIVAATTETDTSFVFPEKAIVVGIGLDVKTKEGTGGTKTIDIGLKSVDADGLFDGASVAAEGIILPTLVSTGQTLGALLRQDENGSGGLVPAIGYSAGGKTLTYSLGSNDFAELVADILVWYYDLTE